MFVRANKATCVRAVTIVLAIALGLAGCAFAPHPVSGPLGTPTVRSDGRSGGCAHIEPRNTASGSHCEVLHDFCDPSGDRIVMMACWPLESLAR